METRGSCRCGIDALQLMTELRNFHTVVKLEMILNLAQRVYDHGQAMLNCNDCRRSLPQSSFLTIPALAEQCISLFEAVCSAYSITRRATIFDPNLLAYEQPMPQFICIRSTVQLGVTDLEDHEASMLVRMLLNRSSMKLLGLLEALQNILRTIPTDSQVHRAGASTLRTCDSSVESIIHSFAVFMEQIKIERGSRLVLRQNITGS
ncbi:hypothetical protein BDV25DRAFT_171705 [Aspergillus avenaceus]|uniref:AflR-like C6 transcription factor n=1 Tax=Aspergillus avenaceus TaxID=36643 RepID=A0A5N6TXJ2_ASPAV|nr:hypothetical protein BDV25DRAFT_171705 [Aspergillus avenaceus]